MTNVWIDSKETDQLENEKDFFGDEIEQMAKESEFFKVSEAEEDLAKAKENTAKEAPVQKDPSGNSIQILFNYRIREDFSHNTVGESGNKIIVVSSSNYKRIGSLFWEKVIKSLDYNFFSLKKGGTSLNFYLEVDFALGSQSQTFRIYFAPDEGKFFISGHSFNQHVGTSPSLKDLDLRIGKSLELSHKF